MKATQELHDRCVALVQELGIAPRDTVTNVTPLTGGVASDIARVDIKDQSYCVKFALPKLKVAADWRAPVHRNAAEYAWLQTAQEVCPICTPRLYGRSETQHGFVMDYLSGRDVYLWKSHLLLGKANNKEAHEVGDIIGQIHARSARKDFDATAFDNSDDFRALRIEPYLTHTKKAHPELSDAITPLEHRLYQARDVLVHGDVSPKNILFRAQRPNVLDAECATMGDASFDPAFCLNHFVLKALHCPKAKETILGLIPAFWQAYGAHVTWEDLDDLEARICALLPVLMLARVDGKSPVEYLNDPQRQFIRDHAKPLIAAPHKKLKTVCEYITAALKETSP